MQETGASTGSRGVAKKGFLNILSGTVGQLIIIAFSIVTPILVIKQYGSEVNGLLHSTEQIFVYLSLLEAGIGFASLQALYKPVAEHDLHEISAIMAATRIYYNRTGLLYTIAVVFFAFLYPLLVASSLPYSVVVGVILLGGLGSGINYFYQGKYILLMQVEGYTYIARMFSILFDVLVNIFKITILLCGFNLLVFQLSYLVMNIVRGLCYCLYIRKHYSYIDYQVQPNFKAVSQKNAVLVHQISNLIFSSTDILLLSLLTQDLKIVSVYMVYSMVINSVYAMVQSVSGGFDFKLGQLFAVDRPQYNRLYHVFEIFHLVIVFAVMSALYLVFIPFVSLYTHSITDINYVNQWYPLLFILVPLLTHSRTAVNSGITFAGHFQQTKRYAIAEAVINLSVSIASILAFGLPGALLGTIAASLYRTVATTRYYYKNISPDPMWKTVKRWTACFMIFIAVVILDRYIAVHPASYVSIALVAIACTIGFFAVYGAILYLIDRDERSMIIDLIKSISCSVIARIRPKNRIPS